MDVIYEQHKQYQNILSVELAATDTILYQVEANYTDLFQTDTSINITNINENLIFLIKK